MVFQPFRPRVSANEKRSLRFSTGPCFYYSPLSRRRYVRSSRFFPDDGLGCIEILGQGDPRMLPDPPGNVDPWIQVALKRYDPTAYNAIRGYTRRGGNLTTLYEQLGHFGRSQCLRDPPAYVKDILKSALTRTRDAFTKGKCRIQPLVNAMDELQRNTSAGWTFNGAKKGEVLEKIFHEARGLNHELKRFYGQRRGTVHFPPCCTAKRGAMAPLEAPKSRLVWLYPAEITALELCYAGPAYRCLTEQGVQRGPMLLGSDADRVVSAWFNINELLPAYGLDFSHFDASISPWMIDSAFDIIWEMFDLTSLTPAKIRKKKATFLGLKDYFINTPLVLPDGLVIKKCGGVPSGSAFTQLVDSICNYLLIQMAAIAQQADVHGLRVLGDDSGFFSREFVVETASAFLEDLGLTLNPDKCEMTTDRTSFKLLGFTYRGGSRCRPFEEWCKFAMYPETYVWNLGQSFTRMLGLLLSGAQRCERFVEFFKYYQSGFPVPNSGTFSRDTIRYFRNVLGITVPPIWTVGSLQFNLWFTR